MTDEMIRKLSVILAHPITSEAQVVYLLIQVRKILDGKVQEKEELEKVYRERSNVGLEYEIPTYSSLILYCNWVAHISLERGIAREIVKEVDRLYPKLITGTMEEEEKAHFRSRFTFQSFRKEFDQFLGDNELPQFDDESWKTFLMLFLGVIRDCPLTCELKDRSLTNVDKVMVISDEKAKELWSGTLPPITWALHLGEIHKFTVLSNFTLDPLQARSKTGGVP